MEIPNIIVDREDQEKNDKALNLGEFYLFNMRASAKMIEQNDRSFYRAQEHAERQTAALESIATSLADWRRSTKG